MREGRFRAKGTGVGKNRGRATCPCHAADVDPKIIDAPSTIGPPQFFPTETIGGSGQFRMLAGKHWRRELSWFIALSVEHGGDALRPAPHLCDASDTMRRGDAHG
jgi:hypothetical protein